MTPWQFQLRLDDYEEAARIEHDERVSLAWLSGTIPRVKQPPKLRDLLSSAKPGAEPTEGIDEDAIKARFAALRLQQNESVH
jgi:hypothetical protein